MIVQFCYNLGSHRIKAKAEVVEIGGRGRGDNRTEGEGEGESEEDDLRVKLVGPDERYYINADLLDHSLVLINACNP